MRIYPHLSAEHLANVYTVVDEDGNALIVDPAHIDRELLAVIEERCSHLSAVLLTHRHETHAEGLGTLLKIYQGVKVYSASDEIMGIPSIRLSDGARFRVGRMDIEAISVPGHSMDSLVYRIDAALFTGDTRMAGTIGSTKSVIEKELLMRSIRAKLLHLPDNCLIYPGHGSLSKIRLEMMFNQDLLASGMAIIGT